MIDGLGEVDEGQEDEADEGPYWREDKHECLQEFVEGPPDGVQAGNEDGAPVGGVGHDGVVFGATFTAAPDSSMGLALARRGSGNDAGGQIGRVYPCPPHAEDARVCHVRRSMIV